MYDPTYIVPDTGCQPYNPSDEIQGLEARIAILEARLAALEARHPVYPPGLYPPYFQGPTWYKWC